MALADLLSQQVMPGFGGGFPSQGGVREMLAALGPQIGTPFEMAEPREFMTDIEPPLIQQEQQPGQPQQQQGRSLKDSLRAGLSNFLLNLGEGLAAGGGIKGMGVAMLAPERRRQQQLAEQKAQTEAERQQRLDESLIQLRQAQAQEEPQRPFAVGGVVAVPDPNAPGGIRFLTPPAQPEKPQPMVNMATFGDIPGLEWVSNMGDVPVALADNLLSIASQSLRQEDQQTFRERLVIMQQESQAQFQAEQNALNRQQQRELQSERLAAQAERAGLFAGQKPPSQQESNTFNYYGRMAQGMRIAEELEKSISEMGLLRGGWLKWAPNAAQGQLGQSYRQAQRAFTEARLRKESGAAIPDFEYENDAKIYFAQPGDNPKTIEQKNKARQQVAAGLLLASGKAYRQSFGDTVEIRLPDGRIGVIPVENLMKALRDDAELIP